MLTNPRDAVRGQSGLQKIVSSHMLGKLSYSLSLRRAVFFRYWTSNLEIRAEVIQSHWKWYHSMDGYDFLLVFYRNFVPNTHRFEIIDFKNAVALKIGFGVRQGRWKYHHSIECIDFLSRSIETMALSRVVFEIFNVEKCCDLEIGVRGHSRPLKVVPFDRLCMVSY